MTNAKYWVFLQEEMKEYCRGMLAIPRLERLLACFRHPRRIVPDVLVRFLFKLEAI
jgi:hypothetical protein